MHRGVVPRRAGAGARHLTRSGASASGTTRASPRASRRDVRAHGSGTRRQAEEAPCGRRATARTSRS
jgi:hypothetical protein